MNELLIAKAGEKAQEREKVKEKAALKSTSPPKINIKSTKESGGDEVMEISKT